MKIMNALETAQALHYQVCNGGFDQWVVNGYCHEHVGYEIRKLGPDSELVKAVADMAEKACKAVVEYEADCDEWLDSEEHEEAYNVKIRKLDRLDQEYYAKYSDDFERLIESL